MSQGFTLMVDDTKTFEADAIARTSQAAQVFLKNAEVDYLYLDHDLGPKSEMNGSELVSWMIENGCVPRIVHVISQNPEGVKNIEAKLRSFGYVYNKDEFYWEMSE